MHSMLMQEEPSGHYSGSVHSCTAGSNLVCMIHCEHVCHCAWKALRLWVQTAAEEARFGCARKMTELESRKRYEFLDAMLSSMHAHLRFFERGHEV